MVWGEITVSPAPENSQDTLVVHYNPGGPIDLAALAHSFAGLARIYARHYGQKINDQDAPKLFISKLETGSIVAEIVPYVMIMGTAVQYMDASMIIADFTQRISRSLRAFVGSEPTQIAPLVSDEDARDLREFIKPLTSRRGASLGIKQARYEKKDGNKSVIVEYNFDETELNLAASNLDLDLRPIESSIDVAALPAETGDMVREAMLFFHQASRDPGREEGRTGDKAIIPSVSDKPLPVHFREGIDDLKARMVKQDVNPLTSAYVVDAQIQRIAGQPKGYIVTEVHRVIPGE